MRQHLDSSRAARFGGVTLAVFLLTLAFAINTPAQGGRSAMRVWVSATTGSDSNPCTRVAPCRDLASAVGAVVEDGEVVILDSGGYDAVEITKSVQIVAPEGVHAVIAPTTGIPVPGDQGGDTTAVLINAPGATVILRNLTVNRLGTINNGIRAAAVDVLHIENCVVNGINNQSNSDGGIYFATNGRLVVRGTTARNNGMGIIVTSPVEGTARASIDRCRLDGNAYGIVASSRAKVAVSNTVAAGGATSGIGFYGAPNQLGTATELSCDNCVASNFTYGFAVAGGSGALIRVARSVATNNIIGFANNSTGGKFKSLAGTNMVDGNTTNRSGSITTFSPDAP